MYTYDHLKGVAERKLLVNSSEAGLVNPVPQAKNLDEFGHRISMAMGKVRVVLQLGFEFFFLCILFSLDDKVIMLSKSYKLTTNWI